MIRLHKCGVEDIDCDVLHLPDKLILIRFKERIIFDEDEELEIVMATDEVSFAHYMAMCGWQGLDDEDLYIAMGVLWGTDEYYGKFKTVEQLLLHPANAMQFVSDYAVKLGLKEDLDYYTVLNVLLNRMRKQNRLKEYENNS